MGLEGETTNEPTSALEIGLAIIEVADERQKGLYTRPLVLLDNLSADLVSTIKNPPDTSPDHELTIKKAVARLAIEAAIQVTTPQVSRGQGGESIEDTDSLAKIVGALKKGEDFIGDPSLDDKSITEVAIASANKPNITDTEAASTNSREWALTKVRAAREKISTKIDALIAANS